MSDNKCPVCGNSKKINLLCNINAFDIFKCGACGSDFVFPMPVAEALKSYYDREVWFEGGEPGGYKNYDQQTAWSVDAIKPVFDEFQGASGLSVLDIGCGYGTHLELAASMGWKCFGVEVSDHARKIAKQRLGGKAYIVESTSDLIPHEFDLVLILDVIEHLPSPYTLLYSLFSIGAITSKTRIVISTPNAGSVDAQNNPAEWAYRHPPSHLVYYSASTLRFLLEKLHFSDVKVAGVSPLELQVGEPQCSENHAGYSGLWATASGSDFTEFMRERYVPGTWSKIAEYEHLPRYQLAGRDVIGKKVLDFGCGTGYGSSALSEHASSVVGLDIDQAAIAWARATHHNPNLTFHCCDDLGATLASSSFDVVTCFEMIEHVDYATQKAAIASISRLLHAEGLFIISTPNPEITKLYGANPYHLREMTLSEFREILKPYFLHIKIVEQRVRSSIAFDDIDNTNKSDNYLKLTGEKNDENVIPLAFIAICSNRPIGNVKPLVVFDDEVDLIQDTLQNNRRLIAANFESYQLGESVRAQQRSSESINIELAIKNLMVVEKDVAIDQQSAEIVRLDQLVVDKTNALEQQAAEIVRLDQLVVDKTNALEQQGAEIVRLDQFILAKEEAITLQSQHIHQLTEIDTVQKTEITKTTAELAYFQDLTARNDQEISRLNQVTIEQTATIGQMEEAAWLKESELRKIENELLQLRQSKWHRLGTALRLQPVTLLSLQTIVHLMISMAMPAWMRNTLRPLFAKARQKHFPNPSALATGHTTYFGEAHAVLQPTSVTESRPRIVHVIANFCVGGSSRLVVDLMESLGDRYQQSVLTSFIPVPPAYTGLDIHECRFPANEEPFVEYFQKNKPELIHVHYWGDCDEPWYSKAFKAAEHLGIRVVENINTPVDPFISSSVKSYIYVSDYVRKVFGKKEPSHITIFPGSNFAHFDRKVDEAVSENCVGMVYRLERDKLNEAAILPFISVVKKRPETHVLIVGGGSLLEIFQKAVAEADVTKNFEFTGYVSYATLPDYYRRMSIFVAPVWKESFGQVSAFAMNMKIPVCGYDVGAIAEIIDNPALVAPIGAHEQLANIMVRLLDSPLERTAVGEQQRQRAQEHFSVEAMIESYRKIYQQFTVTPLS